MIALFDTLGDFVNLGVQAARASVIVLLVTAVLTAAVLLARARR